jgi:hemerythrin superfamily protein
MSIVDKAIAAITPPESAEARARAREKARSCAEPGDWLSMILGHHLMIENAFTAVKAADDPVERRAAQKHLALVLTGHAQAEEAAIYPVLAQAGEKGHAAMGYTEQAAVKMQMAELDNIDPMSQAYLDKLEHIEGAVKHHVFEEEGTWYPEMKAEASMEAQRRATEHYREETERYFGGGRHAAQEPRSFASDGPGMDATV